MAKRSLQQIEESLRAKLAEVRPGGGLEKEYPQKDLGGGGGGVSPIGGQIRGPTISPEFVGPGGQGFGGGGGRGTTTRGPKVWRRGEQPSANKDPVKPAEKPRVQMKPGETQDQAMLRTQREKIAKDRNEQAGATVWRPGESKP